MVMDAEQTNIGRRFGNYAVLEYLTSDELGFHGLYRARCIKCTRLAVIRIDIDGRWEVVKPCGGDACYRPYLFEQRNALLVACI